MKEWKAGFDYPKFMNDQSLTMLDGGYLIGDETPAEAMDRIAITSANLLTRMRTRTGMPFPISFDDLVDKFTDILWKGHLSPSSPMWANMGTVRGLPISCFGSYVDDNMESIADAMSEITMMSVVGGGTSLYAGDIRGRGETIKNKGKSNGVMQFLDIYEGIIKRIKQGNVRDSALASYLDVDHPDIEEFLDIRKVGHNIQKMTMGVNVSDDFVSRVKARDPKALKTWAKVLKTRSERGMPYIFFTDNVNNQKPEWYKKLNKQIKASNLCTEIALPSNNEWSFVCCLASLVLTKYEDFKDDETVFYSVLMLEAVMEDFIVKSENIKHLEKARKFAIENRALGIGAMGWHTFLQEKNLPFTGLSADFYTNEIFGHIKSETERASEFLAEIFGEVKVCKGFGRRHATLTAPAPNVSSSIIEGGVSAGIESIPANIYVMKSAKLKFTKKNKYLEKLLEKLGKNTKEVWEKIGRDSGSVLGLDFLSDDDKEVFLTFSEQNQMEIVKQASIRQKYVDQSQSLNLNFPPHVLAKDINSVILKAHELGIKTLYYQRSESTLRKNMDVTVDAGCVSCDG